MPSSRPSPPKAANHHGLLREALLDAAEAWLADHGPASLTLRALAKSAGVSHAAPYHHFPTREHLLAAVGERAFGRLADAMERAAARARSPTTRLLAICDAYVAAARARPAQFRLMFGALLADKAAHPALQAAAARAFGVLADAAAAYDPARATELALTGWSLAHGAAHLLIDGAFQGLPLPAPQSRRVAAADPQRLVRRMAARLMK